MESEILAMKSYILGQQYLIQKISRNEVRFKIREIEDSFYSNLKILEIYFGLNGPFTMYMPFKNSKYFLNIGKNRAIMRMISPPLDHESHYLTISKCENGTFKLLCGTLLTYFERPIILGIVGHLEDYNIEQNKVELRKLCQFINE